MFDVLLADAVIITALLVWKKWIRPAGLQVSALKQPSFCKPCFLALFLIAVPNLVFIFLDPADIGSLYGSRIVFGFLSMILVGYLEEAVFRGMLFDAIAASSLKQAVIITSLTFGIGHISNLFTGQNLLETLVQIAYAICIGYAFVIARIASDSIWMCVAVHSLIDVLSLFISETISSSMVIIAGLALIAISLAVAWWIMKANPKHRYF